MTWQEAIEKLAYFIDRGVIACRHCPAGEYCADHEDDKVGCMSTIIGWAKEQVEGEENAQGN